MAQKHVFNYMSLLVVNVFRVNSVSEILCVIAEGSVLEISPSVFSSDSDGTVVSFIGPGVELPSFVVASRWYGSVVSSTLRLMSGSFINNDQM